MSTLPLIAIGGFAALVVAMVLLRRGGNVSGALGEAKRSGDVAALVAELDQLPERRQPDAWNHAIKQLWDDYERETAARLVHALASRLPDTRIAQYWLDQVQRVEPEIASELFDEAFLQRHFRPEIAARCGQFG